MFDDIAVCIATALAAGAMSNFFVGGQLAAVGGIYSYVLSTDHNNISIVHITVVDLNLAVSRLCHFITRIVALVLFDTSNFIVSPSLLLIVVSMSSRVCTCRCNNMVEIVEYYCNR